jgi:hypothetical protein
MVGAEHQIEPGRHVGEVARGAFDAGVMKMVELRGAE